MGQTFVALNAHSMMLFAGLTGGVGVCGAKRAPNDAVCNMAWAFMQQGPLNNGFRFIVQVFAIIYIRAAGINSFVSRTYRFSIAVSSGRNTYPVFSAHIILAAFQPPNN